MSCFNDRVAIKFHDGRGLDALAANWTREDRIVMLHLPPLEVKKTGEMYVVVNENSRVYIPPKSKLRVEFSTPDVVQRKGDPTIATLVFTYSPDLEPTAKRADHGNMVINGVSYNHHSSPLVVWYCS